MFELALVFAMTAIAHFAPFPAVNNSDRRWIRENPSNERFMGLSWDAAVAAVNTGQTGKFLVPKKVLEAKSSKGDGLQIEMIVIFQESWCSPQDGNTLADICESMCPLYHGGAEAKYRITTYQNLHGANTVYATKLEDIKAADTW